MDVVVIVAARNEAAGVAATVRAAAALRDVSRVIVVDDGSTDGTGELARGAGAEVVRLEPSRGKGGALDAGVRAAGDPDVVLLLDADLGESASEGALLLAPVVAGEADMAVAIFGPPPRKGGFGLVKGFARRGIAELGGGFRAQAPLSGQRAIDRAALEAARPFAGGYGVEVTTTVRVLRAGLRVVEVPTAMSHAATGRDPAGFAHRGRQYLHVRRALAALKKEGASSPASG